MRRDSINNMRKRHAFLSEIIQGYTNLEDFAKDKREFFEAMGVEFSKGEKCISLYFQLDYTEYEEYYIETTEDGYLKVNPIVDWQNELCANERLNIFTGEIYDI